MLKKRQLILFVIGLLVLVAILFYPFIVGGKVLLTTDAAIKGSNKLPSELLSNLIYYCKSSPLLGNSGVMFLKLPGVLMLFLRGVAWNNLVYPVACTLSSIALYLFLRKKNLTSAPISIAILTAFWLGSNFTLIYPGHIYKPYVVMFFVLSLTPAAKAGGGSLVAGLIWGGCVGLMFVQQPDVAMFFALFSVAYMLFLLWKNQGFRLLQWMKVLVPAAVVAFLFAVGPLLSGYERHVKGAAQMQTQNPKEKWDYVTQWSVPPNEVIDFVAPGYYGWRSGEPEGPYWGRMGRSPGWEKTKQGFRNFKLESTYIGVIPIAFAIFALFACRRSKHRAEILFWAGATVISLLLAFGKYFPLYSLFYQLPVVNNIRNPNKFIQVFQVCLAILAAYGFDALWRSRETGNSKEGQPKPIRIFFWSSLGVLVVMGLWALIATLGTEDGIAGFMADGWPKDAAKTIVQNRAASLWHAVFMTAVVTAVFALFSFQRFSAVARHRNVVAALVVLVIAVDAVKLSKHYLKEMPRSYIEANALTDFLKTNIGLQRVALLSQQGINNIWITYLLPYNRIPSFNFDQMPRMANDYKALLTAGQRDPLTMWRFSAVTYIMAPSNAEKQLATAGCKKAFAYGIADAGNGEIKILPGASGPLAVYELLNTLPRYALFAGSKKGSDDHALASMSDFSRIIIPDDSTLPELNGAGQSGSVEVVSYRAGKVKLHISTEVPSILRCAERYDPRWRASLDGKRVDVSRVDFLCQGVYIPAGDHVVIIEYTPSHLFFFMQCVGYLILSASLVVIILRRKGGYVAD